MYAFKTAVLGMLVAASLAAQTTDLDRAQQALTAADMAGALTSGGRLIASGIIADREHEVVAAFTAAGLLPLERSQEGDWVALVYQKERER